MHAFEGHVVLLVLAVFLCGISVCGFCAASPALALVWHSLGAPSRDKVLLGGHLLWRSVFTGAGLAALGRLSLAHGCGDCRWCHDEAH